MSIRALCVVNPASGCRTSPREELPQVLDSIRAAGFDLDVRETGAEHPTSAELAQQAIDEGFEACLVAGGDGTVQPAARTLLGSTVVLGILPYGSFMNVANGLGIPLEAAKAAQIVGAQHVVRADVGEVCEKVFFETAGVGMDAEVFGAARLLERRKLRPALRRVWRAITQGTHRVTVAVDGTAHPHRVVQLLIANSPYYFRGLTIADAAMDDGLLDVIVYARMGRWALIRGLVGLITKGTYPTRPLTYRGREIAISAREPLAVHADGKVVGKLPVTVSVRPGALRVYAPGRASGTSATASSR